MKGVPEGCCGRLRALTGPGAGGGASRPSVFRLASLPSPSPSILQSRPAATAAESPSPSTSEAATTVIPPTWQVKYLYDGDCPMCRTLKNVLTRQDAGAGRVAFVNIADPAFDPKSHEGIEYEDAMETIHVIKREDGDVVTGPDALKLLYDTVGLGWASRVAALPVVSWFVDRLYDLISKYRLGIGGVDAVIAMKRLSQVEAGEDQCEKHGDAGCDAPEW